MIGAPNLTSVEVALREIGTKMWAPGALHDGFLGRIPVGDDAGGDKVDTLYRSIFEFAGQTNRKPRLVEANAIDTHTEPGINSA
jgi:hypothetical protein